MPSTPSATSRWAAVILWMGMIFLASTDLGSAAHTGSIVLGVLHSLFGNWLSPAAMDEIHFLIRKTAHLTEYAIFGVLLCRALALPPRTGNESRLPLRAGLPVAAPALVLAALYACSDEYHQSFVPSRTSSIRDVAIDTAGAAVGIAFYWALTAGSLRRLAPARDKA